MDRDRVLPRRVLGIAGFVVVAVIAGVALWHGRATINDRERGKTEATDRCISVVRDDVRETFVAAGNAPDASSRLADAAEFTGTRTRTASIGDEARSMLRNEGHSPESVAVNWAVNGTLSIPGYAESGNSYGPKNTFDCSAVVLDDGSVVVTDRRIN